MFAITCCFCATVFFPNDKTPRLEGKYEPHHFCSEECKQRFEAGERNEGWSCKVE